MPEKKYMTRSEILEQTGLSGPELDEYIAAGILPEPVSPQLKGPLDRKTARDLFPASVIWRIRLANRLRREGEAMETIAGQFGQMKVARPEPPKGATSGHFPEQSPDAGTKNKPGTGAGAEKAKYGQPETPDPENAEKSIGQALATNNDTKMKAPDADIGLTNRIMNTLFAGKSAAVVPVCVLSFCMAHLDRAADVLMPEDYFGIVSHLYETFKACAAKHHGVCGAWFGDMAEFYFFRFPEQEFVMNAISCAFAVQAETVAVNRKIEGCAGAGIGIMQNIGIAMGTETAGFITAGAEKRFLVLGPTPAYARGLSRFARNSEIWVAKSGIIGMDSRQVRRLSFGVNRMMDGVRHHVPGIFSKVSHLMTDEQDRSQWKDIADLPVTCVTALK